MFFFFQAEGGIRGDLVTGVQTCALPISAQDAIPQDEIHAFRLAIDATVERVKGFEDFHRRASGLFGSYPLVARKLPTLQRRRPGRTVGEPRNPRPCTTLPPLHSSLASTTY